VDDGKKLVIPLIACVKWSSVMSYDSAKATGRVGPGLLMNGAEWAGLYK